MRKPIKNIGASVRGRLLNLAKERNQPFDLLLTRYTLERFLYRLSLSKHRDRFVLKGAMLLTSTMDDPHRPTRDLDLLGFGDPNPTGMIDIFREICAVDINDAVAFDIPGISVDRIRDEMEYGGLRIKTTADVDGAKVRVLIDIGFGDATEPGLVEIDLPVLLEQPTPHLRAYPYETVIAEKFQAMLALGRANSRMKDFYDIWVLSRSHTFEEDRLARAIAATFERRKTEIPIDIPDALTPAFAADPAKQRQWAAFIRDVAINPGSLAEVNEQLAAFLMPRANNARSRQISVSDE
jgi:predicted nucleotidyltransferase component of viral defense system